MAKDKITEYDATANNNTVCGDVNIAENSALPSDMNNFAREIMSHLAEMNAGTHPVADTMTLADPDDLTKKFRFDGVGITAGNTRVVTMPDADTTLAGLGITQTFTKAQIPSTYTGTGLTLDFDTYQNHIITLSAGSNSLANPSTEAGNVGQTGVIIFIQPSSGSAGTVSLGTDYESIGGSGLTLSSANSAYDVVPYVVKADNSVLLGNPSLGFA